MFRFEAWLNPMENWTKNIEVGKRGVKVKSYDDVGCRRFGNGKGNLGARLRI